MRKIFLIRLAVALLLGCGAWGVLAQIEKATLPAPEGMKNVLMQKAEFTGSKPNQYALHAPVVESESLCTLLASVREIGVGIIPPKVPCRLLYYEARKQKHTIVIVFFPGQIIDCLVELGVAAVGILFHYEIHHHRLLLELWVRWVYKVFHPQDICHPHALQVLTLRHSAVNENRHVLPRKVSYSAIGHIHVDFRYLHSGQQHYGVC